MTIVFITAVALICVGLYNVFELDFSRIWRDLMKREDKITLKDSLVIFTGKEPRGFFKKTNYETSLILKATGREASFQAVKMISLILCFIGIVIALAVDNVFLAPVFGLTFWLIPRFYLVSTATLHKKRMAQELETALSLITSSYKTTENIVVSIKQNIELINPPVRAYFDLFIAETDNLDANVIAALNRMKARIPNAIFHEWVNTLIQCQSDKTLIRCLDDSIQRFSDQRTVQAELMAAIASAQVTVYIMAVICFACLPGFKLLNEEWYKALTTTMPGKAAVAFAFLIVLFSLWQVHKLAGPVEYKGE